MFGAVGDFTVFMRSILSFRGQRVIIIFKVLLDVTFHGEAAGTLFVVPVKVYAGVIIYFPFSGDGVVLFESGKEVFVVELFHVLNAKIIDCE